MPNLIRTESDGSVQILTTFFTGPASISATDGYEAWEVAGGAFRAQLTATARLEIISFLSSVDCSGYVRIYDITNIAMPERILSQTIVTNNLVPTTILGPNFKVTGGHIYQVQIRCEGTNPSDQFNVLNITPQDS